MEKKTTQELINEIKSSNSIYTYLDENKAQLFDLDFKSYLNQLLKQKNCPKAYAIKHSGLSEIYAYQIFSGKKAPSRDKVLALCFGMKLTISEAQHLLNKAGVSELYPRDQRDSVVLFALKKELSIIECNELLYELGYNPLK